LHNLEDLFDNGIIPWPQEIPRFCGFNGLKTFILPYVARQLAYLPRGEGDMNIYGLFCEVYEKMFNTIVGISEIKIAFKNHLLLVKFTGFDLFSGYLPDIDTLKNLGGTNTNEPIYNPNLNPFDTYETNIYDPNSNPFNNYETNTIVDTNLVQTNTEYDYLFKILLIGDSGCGKSMLLNRFVDNTFSDSFITTIGVDFKIKTIDLLGKKVKLQIWDTAGQERFRTITTAYYKGAQGIMVVFDLTNRDSYQNVMNWIQEIYKYGTENVVKLLVGNKCDLEDRKVSFQEANMLANENGLSYIETSSKVTKNIDEAFETISENIFNQNLV